WARAPGEAAIALMRGSTGASPKQGSSWVLVGSSSPQRAAPYPPSKIPDRERFLGDDWRPTCDRCPNLLRRVGPTRAEDFGLHAHVEVTAARSVLAAGGAAGRALNIPSASALNGQP